MELVERLRAAGCVWAEDEARLLIDESRSPEHLEEMVRHRVEGEPLEQIVGWAEFDGRRVLVAPGVFVPRRRSELLVRAASALLRPDAVAVELCCGTGAVAMALAHRHPGLVISAADLDPAAVAVARRNLADLAPVYEGDLFKALPAALRGRIDLVVANAPYVPTDAIATMPAEARLYEASAALDGGPDGLDIQRRLIRSLPGWASPTAHVVIETSRRQADTTAGLIEQIGWRTSVEESDELDATVVVGARRNG